MDEPRKGTSVTVPAGAGGVVDPVCWPEADGWASLRFTRAKTAS